MTSHERPRQRLRLDDVTHDSRPDGRCSVGVAMEWGGTMYSAEVEGLETHTGRIRACAAAALEAAGAATPEVTFELAGVKSVRAFDGWVVVSRINAVNGERAYRLLGSAACEEDALLHQCTVKAVLDAINRVVAKHLHAEGGADQVDRRR